jgi:hypothetical protein
MIIKLFVLKLSSSAWACCWHLMPPADVRLIFKGGGDNETSCSMRGIKHWIGVMRLEIVLEWCFIVKGRPKNVMCRGFLLLHRASRATENDRTTRNPKDHDYDDYTMPSDHGTTITSIGK